MLVTLFNDEFDAPSSDVDRTRWTTPEGDPGFFGRTAIRNPASQADGSGRIQVSDGVAHLLLSTHNPTARTPGDSFWGSEIDSKLLFSLGGGVAGLAFEANVRSPPEKPPGIVTTLFAWGDKTSGLHDEIDWEFVSNFYQPDINPPRVQLNRYANEPLGAGHGEVIPLDTGFDFTVFHTFAIHYFPGRIEWLVDGIVTGVQTTHVPTGPLGVRLNIWAPSDGWPQAYSAALQPTADPAANASYDYQIDWVRVLSTTTNFGDTVQSRISYTLPPDVYNLTLTGGSAINGTGNALDNVIAGNTGNNVLTGNAGNDTLYFNSGLDVLDGGADIDSADFSRFGSAVLVSLNATEYEAWTTDRQTLLDGTWRPLADLSGIENIVGTAYDDLLVGNAHTNRLSGLAGSDTFYVSEGIDTLDGGGGTDTADFSQFAAAVLVSLTASEYEAWTQDQSTLSGGAWRTLADLTNIENIVGSLFSDQLYGDAADNVFGYVGGLDLIDGRGGIDAADFSRLSTSVQVSLNASEYEVWTEFPSLGGSIWRPAADLSAIEKLVGTASADEFYGNSEANHFEGGEGADILDGRGGNDVLAGGLGPDSLTGGAGADRFDFNTSTEGVDIVRDFTSGSGNDVLDLRDIFTGQSVNASNRADYVQLGPQGQASTMLSVDVNGATGGASFVNLAILEGVAGLMLSDMFAQGNLVV